MLMRSDHWVMRPTTEAEEGPQMPVLLGATAKRLRECDSGQLRAEIRAAARLAIRRATSNGTILDFDPDALVIELENLICGFKANPGCQ